MKITVNKDALNRALHNALLFAAKDSARPVLEMVRVTATKGWLTFESTDSYGIIREKVEAQSNIRRNQVTVFVHRTGVMEVQARLKFHEDEDVELDMGAGEKGYKFGLDTCRNYGWYEAVQYPDITRVWQTNEGVTRTGDVALGSWFFEKMGQVKLNRKRNDRVSHPIVLRYGESESRPVHFHFVDTEISGVAMPVRIPKPKEAK